MTTIKKEFARERLLRTQPTFSQSFMVSVYISKLGYTDLVFVDRGVKINGAYYRMVCAPVKAASTRDAWGIRGIFQLSTGRRHCAISRAMPAFISPHLWPTNSPDLNLVAYKIWSVIQQRVRAYQSRVHDSDELKQCMQQVWHNIDQSIIDNAIAEWRKRFGACVQANGGHL